MRFAIPDNFPVVYTDDHPALALCVRVASHPIEHMLTILDRTSRFVGNRNAAR